MIDALSILLVAGSLIPFFYFLPSYAENIFTLAVLILLAIPTIMGLVNGAPFVPTPVERVKKMLEIAKLKKNQKVYDIGCGDGRIVHYANKLYGAKATGFEISPLVYLLARVRKFFWRSKAEIKFADYKLEDLSDADVIFCYLMPDTLAKIQKDISKQVKPGTKWISYAFQIPEWDLVYKEEKDPSKHFSPIWVYQKP